MDNYSKAAHKRYNLILYIQEEYRKGTTLADLVRITGKSWKTVKKYVTGDPPLLAKITRRSDLDTYTEMVIQSIIKGMTATEIVRQVKANGYQGTSTNVRIFAANTARRNGLHLKKWTPVDSESSEKKPRQTHVTRKDVFNHLWMEEPLPADCREYIVSHFPVFYEIETCVREFKEVFEKKSMPYLYLFIERYRMSSIKELSSFASGLEKDLSAVENAVASSLSNGFVEGTNNKLKSIKRTMYGRCSRRLLTAKLMYKSSFTNS